MGFSAFMYIYVNITEQCAQVSSQSYHFLGFKLMLRSQAPIASNYQMLDHMLDDECAI